MFFGRITTSAGEITFLGNATAPLTFRDGKQAFVSRTEKTSYFLDGRPYVETSLTIIGESSEILGEYRLMKETDKTDTFFADGSQRTSQITIVYQRDEHATCTGKSGSGTVFGTDLVEGRLVSYDGTIGLNYIFGLGGIWHKAAYYENRAAASRLIERVPFEVMFIDDPLMRSIF